MMLSNQERGLPQFSRTRSPERDGELAIENAEDRDRGHRSREERRSGARQIGPGAGQASVPGEGALGAPSEVVERGVLEHKREEGDGAVPKPSPPDEKMKTLLDWIKDTKGASMRIRVSKRNDSGSWAYLAGGTFSFNPVNEDPNDIEEKVSKMYGAGDYMVTFTPPRETGVRPFKWDFSIMNPLADEGGDFYRGQTRTSQPQLSGILSELGQFINNLNSPQNRGNADVRQLSEKLEVVVNTLNRMQEPERYDRRHEEPPPYEYPPAEDPEIRAMKDSMARMERLMSKFIEAQMTPRKDDGGSITAMGETMAKLMTAMRPAAPAQTQGTSIEETLKLITALKGKEEPTKSPDSKLLDTVLAIVGTQGRDQLDMLLRGFDMGKKGEMSADALADLREEKEPSGAVDKLIGLGEKFAEALGTSVGSKIGDAAANFATTGSPVPAAPSMAGPPAIRFPGPRVPAPVDEQALVRRQPPPPPPHPATEPAHAPAAAPVQPAPHVQGGPKPAQFQRPGTGHPPPQAAPAGVPPELSQGFVNALSSDEPPESIAAKTMMMINAIAGNPEAAPGMGAFLESFKLPLDEGLAKLKPMMVPSHFEKIVSMRPKVEKTYAEIQKLVGTAGAS